MNGMMLMVTTTLVVLLVGGVDGVGQDTWVKTWGGTGYDVVSSTTTSDDGILITGYTPSNDGDFRGMNKGDLDIFIIKLDKHGNTLWKKNIGGTGPDFSSSITTASDGSVLITGKTGSNDGDFKGMSVVQDNGFIMKLDRDGNIQWKSMLGRGITLDVTTTSDDGIMASGESDTDIYVIKLDNDGKVVWKKMFGGNSMEQSSSITSMSNGDILITGYTSSTDGDFKGMRNDRDGDTDILIMKLDRNGNIQWKNMFGGTNIDVGSSISSTTNDDVLIAGNTRSNDGDFKGINRGEKDIFVIKLDMDGRVLWKKTYGGKDRRGHGEIESIRTTSDGGVLIAGSQGTNIDNYDSFTLGDNGTSDIFVIKLDMEGRVLWKKTFRGKDDDLCYSMTTTTDEEILISGLTESNDGDFKGTNRGSGDIFVIKLDKNGNLKPQGKKSKKK